MDASCCPPGLVILISGLGYLRCLFDAYPFSQPTILVVTFILLLLRPPTLSPQYILWRRLQTHGGNVKGFGFTLRGECDFKLDEFHSTSVEFFEPYYGLPLHLGTPKEEEPNGDVTRPENLEALQDVIFRGTGGKGRRVFFFLFLNI